MKYIFPNLVALNIDLQAMTSSAVLERILNMEKAFVGERNESQSQNLVPFEIDSGAAVSNIAKEWVHRLKLNMEPCNKKLRAYDNMRIDVLGKVLAPVLYNTTKVSQRLPFGLSSSPGIFQRFISQLLANVEGVAAYLDDIIVSGATKKEHDHRLRKVLELLQAHNVQINKTNTVLETDSIEYLGYHISGEGVKPSSKGLKAILDCPCPTSVEEVQSFLGMITYNCKVVKNFSSKLAPLNFVDRTDHKQLLGLFGRGKRIPCNTNSRIQRWALLFLLLSQYDYELVHKPGKDVIADAVSRLPLDDDFHSGTSAECVKLVELLDFDDISFQAVKRFTNKDAVLSQLINFLKLGWSKEHNMSLLEYASVKDDLSLHNDVILYRKRVLIPVELRCKVLNHLHCGHNGVNAMKAEARNWVWWPKIDQDIGEVTKNCSICFKNFTNPQAPTLSWPIVGNPWSRLHIDYAGPIDGKYFFIIVNSHSKFLYIRFSSSTMSAVTIGHLRKTFCNFGIPDIIVSDNASNFVSHEMEEFLHKNSIKYVTLVALYHPSSNGLAERAVRTFKEGLGKFKKGDIQNRICRFLYNYRTVNSSTDNNNRGAEVTVNNDSECSVQPPMLRRSS
ncbi:uncharacterized protein K02A2.6-like [Macrobrachium nipponense]|uniref:uncharacterized protein K02A2.6-like n=1 Tax=Macrobrachium nipponense TaxID=159736 RepID=UPI0030C88FD4